MTDSLGQFHEDDTSVLLWWIKLPLFKQTAPLVPTRKLEVG